jgi:hypothetical protein
MFPTPHICERQRVSERSPPLPPFLYLGKAFLGRKFLKYGDGILGQMFANCAKFCTTESRESLTEVSLYLLQPSYRSSKVYRHQVGLNEASKLKKQFLIPDEWTYSSSLWGSPMAKIEDGNFRFEIFVSGEGEDSW